MMPRLLLIDEKRLVLEFERSFVRRRGFDLVTARGGAEILEQSVRSGADLIIARTRMSDMTGVELCRRLRADPRTASIRLLLIGDVAESGAALEAGAEGFLPAPWTRSHLLETVRLLLAVADRGADRVRTSLKVLCGGEQGSYVAFARDISTSGIFLNGVSTAHPGERLRLRMRLPDEPTAPECDLSGEVVRIVPAGGDSGFSPGFAVRFVECVLDRKVALARFIRGQVQG